jgi:hypothetical protein
MWTERHRTRHETRLKDMVLQASLDEVPAFWSEPIRRAVQTQTRRAGCWRGLLGTCGSAAGGGLCRPSPRPYYGYPY